MPVLRRAMPALLLAGLALAGCVAGPEEAHGQPAPFDPAVLSPQRFQILAPEEVLVTASDGVRLHTVVYRPNVAERVPVFINFSPYWGDSATEMGDAFATHLVQEYVPRGYAVVLAALRGTGHSEGCFQIGSDRELRDAYEVVDHFAKAAWSTGLVAAGGKSYDSTTQNGLVAKMPHPALRGIFHVSAITDMYGYNAKDGVVYRGGLDFTPRYFAEQGLDEYGIPVSGSPGPSPSSESPESLRRLASDLLCPEAARHVASGEGTAVAGMRDGYWDEREWTRFLPDSAWDGSVFFVHGLQDWNVKPDHIDPWLRILQAKGNPVLGWLHQETHNNGHVYPMRADWNATMLRWLDHTLKGRDTAMHELWGFEVQGSDGLWRRSSAWPPEPLPAPSVEFRGSLLGALEPVGGSEPGRYAGTPRAAVDVTPHGPDDVARLVLYDVGPDGARRWVNEAVRRLALDDDLHGARPYAPGARLSVNLTFYPMDHVLAPGHSWSLEVGTPMPTPDGAGSTPPDFFIRPDQGGHPEYHQVVLELPLAAMEGVVDPQPASMRCFAC